MEELLVRETDREAELRALMAMASHDLKSPLTSVVARVDMLREDYATALGEDFAREITAIERNLHRITRMAQDLLEFSTAGDVLTLVAVDLWDLVAEVVADHGTAEFTVSGTMPVVRADAGLLRRVVDNLVGNAVKYTRPGETPRIDLRADPGPDGLVLIEVADHGIGIPAADRARVFDAFHRCANSGGRPGTGLGLAICQRIVERHGGRIGVEDTGDGSRFWLTVQAA